MVDKFKVGTVFETKANNIYVITKISKDLFNCTFIGGKDFKGKCRTFIGEPNNRILPYSKIIDYMPLYNLFYS